MVSSGCYRDMCIELELGRLAVNTVIQHALIEELEGSMSMKARADAIADSVTTAAGDGKEVGTGTSVGAVGSGEEVMEAFKILKGCVRYWFEDAVRNGNVGADALLSNFYRWLRSPRSKLYDPSLHR